MSNVFSARSGVDILWDVIRIEYVTLFGWIAGGIFFAGYPLYGIIATLIVVGIMLLRTIFRERALRKAA